jgi:uracil phosphoribosyltransferase
MPLHLASHPVISAKMTALRDRNTKTVDFRRLLKDITNFVGFEATRTLQCSKLEVTTPMGATHTGSEICDKHCIIPILR